MSVSKIPRTIFALLEPAVWSLAARLLILTTERKGAQDYKPTVATFYETGIVTALYEALLMSPALAHLEIRHEMGYKKDGRSGAPKQVDLWLRPHDGGQSTLIEAGDFSAPKVHRDLAKIAKLNPKGHNWFLAFFRTGSGAIDPWQEIQNSIHLPKKGLDPSKVKVDRRLTKTFKVYRPAADGADFGAALIKAP